MLWGEFRGGGSYVLFSTTREYFLEIKVKKKKNCILNIQYSIDRDKKKIGDIIEIYVFFVLNKS